MKEKEVRIELTNGQTINLKDLNNTQLEEVKLSTEGDETFLTMKSCVTKEDVDFIYEKRLYKWKNMPKLVMYELQIPKSIEAFKKIETEQTILKLALEQWAIKNDKRNSGTLQPGDPEKYLDKLTSALLAQGVSVEEVEAIRVLGKETLSKKGIQETPQTNSQKVILKKRK